MRFEADPQNRSGIDDEPSGLRKPGSTLADEIDLKVIGHDESRQKLPGANRLMAK